jgi:hypothetical protein
MENEKRKKLKKFVDFGNFLGYSEFIIVSLFSSWLPMECTIGSLLLPFFQ